MRHTACFVLSLFLLILILSPLSISIAQPPTEPYVEPVVCGSCHLREFQRWRGTVHANASYLAYERWVETHPSEPWPPVEGRSEFATRCLSCHATDYDPATSKWGQLDVTCNTCHGPGHSRIIDYSSAQCGKCHGLGDSNELLWFQKSSMSATMSCKNCHDPHTLIVVKTCADCHKEQAKTWQRSIHSRINVTCVSCHGAPISFPTLTAPHSYSGSLFISPWNSSYGPSVYNITNYQGFWAQGRRFNHTWTPTIPNTCILDGCHGSVALTFYVDVYEHLHSKAVAMKAEANRTIMDAAAALTRVSTSPYVNETRMTEAIRDLEAATSYLHSLESDHAYFVHDPYGSIETLREAVYLARRSSILANSSILTWGVNYTVSVASATTPLEAEGLVLSGSILAVAGIMVSALVLYRARRRSR